jgi:CO dehydrogenase nickel-insertion accessory protein CooC1
LTTTIAITGKSGSGKTTITKAFLKVLTEKYPEKSVLLFDNDLTCELGRAFNLDIRNTIHGIRSGKHEYRTGIPEQMTKQEYVEWAIEDIVIPIEDNIDIIVSWLSGSKNCRCPITEQINDALSKLIERYDFVIFDCEFDLKYLNQLIDTNIDLTMIIANPTIESINLVSRINEYSAKYAVGGQMGIVLNKAGEQDLTEIYSLAKSYDLDILGSIPYDKNLSSGSLNKDSNVVIEAIRNLYFRLNLPQENN